MMMIRPLCHSYHRPGFKSHHQEYHHRPSSIQSPHLQMEAHMIANQLNLLIASMVLLNSAQSPVLPAGPGPRQPAGLNCPVPVPREFEFEYINSAPLTWCSFTISRFNISCWFHCLYVIMRCLDVLSIMSVPRHSKSGEVGHLLHLTQGLIQSTNIQQASTVTFKTI